jgi:putative restriction endonuclease
MLGIIDAKLVGKAYNNRLDLSKAEIHRPPQAGIWGSQYEGAYSIVLSGGYEDDYDNLTEIKYTGQGGRNSKGKMVKDQELIRGNKALTLNIQKKIPVRVIRGYQIFYGPQIGYRYDGLYSVEEYEYIEGFSGFKVFKFYLKSLLSNFELEKITGFEIPN